MTILAGIICKEFIVLGADSQLNDPQDGSIENVDFLDNHVLVAEACVPSIPNRVVEIMREKASDKKINRWPPPRSLDLSSGSMWSNSR